MAAAALLLPPRICAQDAPAPTPDSTSQPAAAPSPDDKWRNFKDETVAPFILLASGATAVIQQAAKTDPQYGAGRVALAERFGAAMADNVSQNFFSDLVLASALHEDTRYRRQGGRHGFWYRFGYAVSRAFVTQTDSGGRSFNWSNFLGCGLQAALSNAYYPATNRNVSATAVNWANSVGASGFGNLFPEFLPDFKRLLKRLHL